MNILTTALLYGGGLAVVIAVIATYAYLYPEDKYYQGLNIPSGPYPFSQPGYFSKNDSSTNSSSSTAKSNNPFANRTAKAGFVLPYSSLAQEEELPESTSASYRR
jgi:hypothetical protein